jgi:hypothetical protein
MESSLRGIQGFFRFFGGRGSRRFIRAICTGLLPGPPLDSPQVNLLSAMSDENQTRFEEAGAQKNASLLGELFAMLKQNKKYWLIPVVIVLLFFGLLIILGASSAAPFIYTLF